MSKFAKGNDSKKTFFLKNKSPGNLLIISYQLTKFEAPSFDLFLRYLYNKFSMAKFAKGNNSKKTLFLQVSPINPSIILYQLAKSEAPSYISF